MSNQPGISKVDETKENFFADINLYLGILHLPHLIEHKLSIDSNDSEILILDTRNHYLDLLKNNIFFLNSELIILFHYFWDGPENSIYKNKDDLLKSVRKFNANKHINSIQIDAQNSSYDDSLIVSITTVIPCYVYFNSFNFGRCLDDHLAYCTFFMRNHYGNSEYFY